MGPSLGLIVLAPAGIYLRRSSRQSFLIPLYTDWGRSSPPFSVLESSRAAQVACQPSSKARTQKSLCAVHHRDVE